MCFPLPAFVPGGENRRKEKEMEYEGQICRSPMERASYMLPVAVGCSHNA